jgi:hypothetical protein
MGRWIFKCFGCCSQDIKKIGKHWDNLDQYDNSLTTKVLEIQWTPMEQTVQEMGDSLLALGTVKLPPKK